MILKHALFTTVFSLGGGGGGGVKFKHFQNQINVLTLIKCLKGRKSLGSLCSL